MAELSKIKVNNILYDFKDANARSDISSLQSNKVNGAYTIIISDTAPAAGTADNVITLVVHGNE